MSISNVGDSGLRDYSSFTKSMELAASNSYDALKNDPNFNITMNRYFSQQPQETYWNIFYNTTGSWGYPQTIEGFLFNYFNTLGTTLSPELINQWSSLIRESYITSLDTYLDQIGVELTDAEKNHLFENQFNAFYKEIYENALAGKPTPGITTFESFLDAFDNFCSSRVLIAEETYQDCLTYIRVFFKEPNDQQEIELLLKEFILKTLSESDGIVDRGQFLQEWYTICQDAYFKSIGFDPQKPVESSYQKTQIIMMIYRLLRQLVGELQLLTAAQTQYQNFLTKLDGAYNKAIANIPLTTDIPGASDDEEAEMKADAQMAEQRWTENLRSRQSEAQDLLKQLQTLLGQSNEATNQAGNFIAQFIQTLQGLLSSIFR